MQETKRLVERCFGLNYKVLPAEVVDRAKDLLLDYLGVAARGALSDSSRPVQRTINHLDPSHRGAVVIGTKLRASPPLAALANGTAAHSIELDDVVNEASLHPGVTVMSTALAAGHMAGCTGKQLIEAIVAGYETVVRLGIGLDPSAHYARGFHPTATCGTMGSAITAAKSLKLNPKEMINALGISGSQAAGSMEFLADGAFTKRFHAGWAAHSGLLAALLAREGFTGPTTIIEGKFGFLKAYSPRPNPDRILKGWGQPFQVLKTSIKPHACCRYKQGPIDGILKIMRANRLAATDIESVTLGILKTGFPIIVQPEMLKLNPKTIVDAQFSMPFGAAVAILYGSATLEEYTKEKLHAPEVKDMMRRIRCVEAPELEKEFPQKWPAIITIKTTSGQEFKVKIDFPRGDPENPLSPDELIQKFKGLTRPVFPDERIDKIIDRVLSIEKAGSLKGLTALLLKD
ncbi:MmgE/PrpD family protein [Thermodesulfobacteriota bacterium]